MFGPIADQMAEFEGVTPEAFEAQRAAGSPLERLQKPEEVASIVVWVAGASGMGLNGRLVFTDQFFIGDVIGKKLSHIVKLASLVLDDPATYNSERVANRNGAHMRSFADEQQAIEWLLGQDAQPG